MCTALDQQIAIRVVPMALPDLDYPSKLDRSAELIDRLLQHGAEQAPNFLHRTRYGRAQTFSRSMRPWCSAVAGASVRAHIPRCVEPSSGGWLSIG